MPRPSPLLFPEVAEIRTKRRPSPARRAVSALSELLFYPAVALAFLAAAAAYFYQVL